MFRIPEVDFLRHKGASPADGRATRNAAAHGRLDSRFDLGSKSRPVIPGRLRGTWGRHSLAAAGALVCGGPASVSPTDRIILLVPIIVNTNLPGGMVCGRAPPPVSARRAPPRGIVRSARRRYFPRQGASRTGRIFGRIRRQGRYLPRLGDPFGEARPDGLERSEAPERPAGGPWGHPAAQSLARHRIPVT